MLGDAKITAAKNVHQELREKLQRYACSDIYNADECGLNNCMKSDRNAAMCSFPGEKKAKERITDIVYSNTDMSDKLRPMMTDNAAKNRPFRNRSDQELGFEYHCNIMAWMKSRLLYDCLNRLKSHIASTPGRKAVLMLDKCSAHESNSTIPELENVQVLFSSLKTRSMLQPMDARIMEALKMCYRKFHHYQALNLMDEG